MGQRHIARQRALEVLYALEFGPPARGVETVFEAYKTLDAKRSKGFTDFAQGLARATWEERDRLDERIAPLLHNWKLERLPLLEKLLMRMAVCELQSYEEIPLRVTINEYLELARRYSNEEATPYINAVLDKIARDHPAKDFQREKPSSAEESERRE